MAKIALLDDDPGVREVLGEILRMHGHEVHGFADGAPFFQTAEIETFDLVILDLVMQMDGETVVQILSQLLPGLPILVIAGHVSNAKACYLLAAGAHDILQKPVPMDIFIQTVYKWLNIAKPRDPRTDNVH